VHDRAGFGINRVDSPAITGAEPEEIGVPGKRLRCRCRRREAMQLFDDWKKGIHSYASGD
jgi:hypothetical protein